MSFFSFFKKRKAFEKLVGKFKKGRELKFEEYLKLGNYYREQGLYSKALRIHKSLELKKGLSDEEKARLNKSLGFDYFYLYQYRSAIKHFEKADDFFRGEDEEVRSGLLKAYEFSGDWDSAIELKKEIFIINKEYSDEKMAHYILIAAEDMIKRGNRKKAKKYLKEAMKLKNNLDEIFLYMADVEENPFKKMEYLEKIADKYPLVVYKKIQDLKMEFFEKGKMEELLGFLENSENMYFKLIYVSLLLQKGECEKAREILESFPIENENLFLNLMLLPLILELDMSESAKQISYKIEKKLKELEFVCTGCKKEYVNFRLRCENCGEVNKVRLNINF